MSERIHGCFLAGLVVLAGLALGSGPALAQVKIGVVDLQTAVASTKAGKSAKEKLEKLAKKKQKELDDKVAAITKMEDELKAQLPVMSEAGKQDMIKKYREAGMELQELYVKNQQYMAKKKAEMLEPILQKMGSIIQDLALSDGYTVILDRSEGTVLYFEPATDLTPRIIKAYNDAK